METFSEMINEDFASIINSISSYVTKKGEESRDKFLAKYGNAKAQGKVDLRFMIDDLESTWEYYAEQQGLKKTPHGIVDFLTTVFGMKMDEDAVYRAIYGVNDDKSGKPPVSSIPDAKNIMTAFKGLLQKNINSTNISLLANKIALFGKENDDNAKLIVQWMKYVAEKNPSLIKNNSMKVLVDYAHGGILTDAQFDTIILSIARSLLKKQTIADRSTSTSSSREASSAATSGKKKPDADGDGTPDDEDTGDDTDKNKKYKKIGNVLTNPPSTMQEGDFGGLKRPTQRRTVVKLYTVLANLDSMRVTKKSIMDMLDKPDNISRFDQWEKTYSAIPINILNAASAQLMQLVVRRKKKDFESVMKQAQEGIKIWPVINMIKAYDFIQMGGNPDEVTAELNHFITNQRRAAHIMISLVRFEALCKARDGDSDEGSDGGDENT